MRPAMVSGLVSRDAPVNCWPKLKGDLHDDVFWLLRLEYRILQGFAFLCKLGLLLCKPLQDYQTKYERKNEMDSASSSKMTSSHARLAFLCNIILNIPEIFLMLMILPLVWRYQICFASFLYSLLTTGFAGNQWWRHQMSPVFLDKKWGGFFLFWQKDAETMLKKKGK